MAKPDDISRENWARYLYGKDRGHTQYTEHAMRCSGMYLGGGEQWSPEDRAILDSQGRPHYEFNEVMPSINSAIGYQIHNRMDIVYKPRGGQADLETANTLTKLVKQVTDANMLHWNETQLFSDGLIEQRGYYDLRMDFDSNILGEIAIAVLDPSDVIPDPDAKAYDPDRWSDVVVTRWLTLDEIEQRYGRKARDAAADSNDDGPDFGDMDDEAERSKFGMFSQASLYDAYKTDEQGFKRFRVIERQRFVYENTACIVHPHTGDVLVEAKMADDTIADALAKGAVRAKRMKRRVKWEVTTWCRTLHNDYSPYEHFTIVPYFAYFRRGQTRGMVDAAIGPQEVLNKAVSQFVHILNSSANGGWMVQQDSLTNMTTEELEDVGAQTGLVIEYRGDKPPQKIGPNQVPTGIDRIIDRADKALKDVTVPDAMRGSQGPEISGIAIQSKQFASQQQLAVPLDNLAYTRHLLAIRLTKLIQRYYDSYRIFRITEMDPLSGKPTDELLEINKFDPTSGNYINDVTVGTYDVVISEQPMQVTFENSQFQQVMEMRNAGVRLPDATVIRYSNLADKPEILEAMQNTQGPVDPTLQAKAELMSAQALKARADAGLSENKAVGENAKTQYSTFQTAQIIEMMPGTASTADGLLGSAGYIDHDAPPIVPGASGVDQLAGLGAPGAMAEPVLPPGAEQNTNPVLPANPAVGMMTGIKTPGPDGLQP